MNNERLYKCLKWHAQSLSEGFIDHSNCLDFLGYMDGWEKTCPFSKSETESSGYLKGLKRTIFLCLDLLLMKKNQQISWASSHEKKQPRLSVISYQSFFNMEITENRRKEKLEWKKWEEKGGENSFEYCRIFFIGKFRKATKDEKYPNLNLQNKAFKYKSKKSSVFFHRKLFLIRQLSHSAHVRLGNRKDDF